MRLPDHPQEDDGRFALPRGRVIDTLIDHKIRVDELDGTSSVYRISKRNHHVIVVVFPEKVPAQMIFELAAHYGFQADDFYQN